MTGILHVYELFLQVINFCMEFFRFSSFLSFLSFNFFFFPPFELIPIYPFSRTSKRKLCKFLEKWKKFLHKTRVTMSFFVVLVLVVFTHAETKLSFIIGRELLAAQNMQNKTIVTLANNKPFYSIT